MLGCLCWCSKVINSYQLAYTKFLLIYIIYIISVLHLLYLKLISAYFIILTMLQLKDFGICVLRIVRTNPNQV
jgi:hypothetical protein